MLGLIYSVVSYLIFLGIYTYFAFFGDGQLVPKSVDSGATGQLAVALGVDVSLMLLFGIQHSVMARPGFKRALTRVVPAPLERSTYVLASSAALALLMWQWRPLSTTLWHVESLALAVPLWSINALGWLGVPVSSFMIDHFDLFGLKQALASFRKTSMTRRGFVTPLFYKYVRHPMMTSLLAGLWVTPHMTVGHMLLSTGMSIYIVIGVHFEERGLARELGSAYERYQASTAKFLPGRASNTARSAADATGMRSL